MLPALVGSAGRASAAAAAVGAAGVQGAAFADGPRGAVAAAAELAGSLAAGACMNGLGARMGTNEKEHGTCQGPTRRWRAACCSEADGILWIKVAWQPAEVCRDSCMMCQMVAEMGQHDHTLLLRRVYYSPQNIGITAMTSDPV